MSRFMAEQKLGKSFLMDSPQKKMHTLNNGLQHLPTVLYE